MSGLIPCAWGRLASAQNLISMVEGLSAAP
jgi:hypothetical protein